MISTVLPSPPANDMSLSLQHSTASSSIGIDHSADADDEQSLSFSVDSSAADIGDDASKFSNHPAPLDENNNCNAPSTTRGHVITVDSLTRLYAAFPGVSNISTSASTAIMSNTRQINAESGAAGCNSPPDFVLGNNESSNNNPKRSIFGKQTKKKYNVRRKINSGLDQALQNSPVRRCEQQMTQIADQIQAVDLIESSVATPDEQLLMRGSNCEHQSSNDGIQKSPMSDLMMEQHIPTPTENLVDDEATGYSPIQPTNKTLCTTPPRTPRTPSDNNNDTVANPPPLSTVGYQKKILPMSPLTPMGTASQIKYNGGYNRYNRYSMSRISDADESSTDGTNKEYAVHFDPTTTGYNNYDEPHSPEAGNVQFAQMSLDEDSHNHAQALLLSLAFFFIWSPQNLLAPNLTQAAYDFGYGDDTHARDFYLGSNLALATSVLSLPFSALIGFASDAVSSRRILISVTTFVGGMAAIATGMATTYPQLILSRFVSGSCMSGSVPVVFSLLSDWFDAKDRNAASSGFTAMMGAGIILGQVYAGFTGPTAGWRHSFYTSGFMTMILSVLVLICVKDPIRGGKEKVLREMLAQGRKYEKQLTWSQFVSSMTNHSSNRLLMLQGFFCNLPWGIMFVFLNDFLSQEKGLTVVDATFIVAVFGFGCAVGGILGGFLGSLCSRADRRYLPLFMALTTLLGIGPFLALLDDPNYDHAGLVPCLYAFTGGCLASMPSVNIRPCIINVNPPEIRGAALTAANLIINAARGAGPTVLTTVMMGMLGVNRASGFNIMIIVFWVITAIQLALLAKTLPLDQERMETELANYANAYMDVGYGSMSIDDDTRESMMSVYDNITLDGTIFSIDNQALSFDAVAARQSLQFMGDSLREVGKRVLVFVIHQEDVSETTEFDSMFD